MAQVKFLKGLSEAYTSLVGKYDEDTFYFTTDDNVLYLGSHRIGADPSLADAVAALQTTVNKLDGEVGTEGSVKKQINDAIENLKTTVIGNLQDLTIEVQTTVVAAINALEAEIKAADGKIEELSGKIGDLQTLETTSKDSVVTAINDLNTQVKQFSSSEAVKVTKKGSPTDGYAVSYEVTQGGASVGTIDIPKDMVVSSARVETIAAGETEEKQHDEGTYIVLVIANKEEEELWIDVGKLVDIYTAAEDATNVELTIDQSKNTIKAAIKANGVTNAELADDAVTTEKIADGQVTSVKLHTEVQASLGKADSALQSSDISEGTEDGAITVKDTQVKVHGLDTVIDTKITTALTWGTFTAEE